MSKKKIEIDKKPIGIVITDTHLSIDNIDKNISIWNQAIDYAVQYKVPIFHAGDFFKDTKGQPEHLLNTLLDIKHKCKENNIKVYAIAGNHDKQSRDSERSYLDVYHEDDVFEVIRKYSRVAGNIFMLPYFKENGEKYLKYLNAIKEMIKKDNVKNPILITHIAVSGVRNNDNSEVINLLQREMFDCFEVVLCGHYHDKSIVGSNIYYIGSTLQHNYGENDDKGIVLLYNDGTFEYLETKFPKYIKIEISVDELNLKLINELEKERIETGDDIRLIIKGEKSKIQSIKKSLFSDTGLSVKTEINEIQEQILKAETQDSIVSFDSGKIKEYFFTFCMDNEFDLVEGEKYLSVI